MVISHDRYFLNKVISRILELKEDGVSEYLGNYSYYQEKKLNPSRFESYEELANGKTKTQLKDEKKKKREAEKEAKAIQLKIKNLEKTISEKEDELKEWFSDTFIEDAKAFLNDISVVPEGLIARILLKVKGLIMKLNH